MLWIAAVMSIGNRLRRELFWELRTSPLNRLTRVIVARTLLNGEMSELAGQRMLVKPWLPKEIGYGVRPMLPLGLFLLVCSMASAIFGFSVYAPAGWTWEKSSALLCLTLSVAAYLSGIAPRAMRLPDTLDRIAE